MTRKVLEGRNSLQDGLKSMMSGLQDQTQHHTRGSTINRIAFSSTSR